jgi:hypothetical protein
MVYYCKDTQKLEEIRDQALGDGESVEQKMHRKLYGCGCSRDEERELDCFNPTIY